MWAQKKFLAPLVSITKHVVPDVTPPTNTSICNAEEISNFVYIEHFFYINFVCIEQFFYITGPHVLQTLPPSHVTIPPSQKVILRSESGRQLYCRLKTSQGSNLKIVIVKR